MKLINYSSFFSNQINLYMSSSALFHSETKKNRTKKIQELLDLEQRQFITPEQIHSDKICFIETDSPLSPKCDSIIFHANSQLIGTISVADCVPICIYDYDNEIISLVHSGWRGTLKNIVRKSVIRMTEFGSKKENLKIFLGPSIRWCCYQVDKTLSEKFDKRTVRIKKKKYFIDLVKQIRFDLKEISIPDENLLIQEDCTYENNKYHSFRRDGNLSGRMTLIAYKN